MIGLTIILSISEFIIEIRIAIKKAIKIYCEKTGASSVDIPAKNYEDKKGDVDIIATF